MGTIEALYIVDEHNNLIFSHVYSNQAQPASLVLQMYLQQPIPRPSVIYLPSTNPATIIFSIIQDNLLFLSPSSRDNDPLLVLEFLHRVADALQEFVGSPLLATKLTANYDVAAQVVAEMADSGVICQGEANALRDVVETGPGVLQNLLGGVGLPSASPALRPQGGLQHPLVQPTLSSQGSAIPWRRNNVRHTSNELYVDIVESLSVTLAPSGRPLSAFANGSIAFTSQVSGVPDLLLNISTGGKGAGMGSRGDQLRGVMKRVVFHPCVRLNKWKTDGVLSFIPPDGRFALCGYEVDLLGPELNLSTAKAASHGLSMPATIEIRTGLGSLGNEFEVSALPSGTWASATRSPAAASLQSHLSAGRSSPFRPSAGTGDSKSPALEEVTVHVPLPPAVRNVSELRATRGEAHWNAADGGVEWKIPTKDFGPNAAVLKITVQGPLADDDEERDTHTGGIVNGMSATTYDYDEDQPQAHEPKIARAEESSEGKANPQSRADKNKALMPSSATLSFSVKGWLASGLKVDSLLLDTKKSRGLGPEVKPYKGVKYLTLSRKGIEVRC